MKKTSIFITILFALGLYMVPASFATGGSADSKDKPSGQSENLKDQKRQAQGQQGLNFQQQKQNLLLSDNLIGTEIQNQQGEKIGEIDSVLVDVENGQVGFVTMTSGGVLGVGAEKYIVPFNALQKKMPQGEQALAGERQDRQVVFTLNKQKDQLKKVPEGNIEEALTQEGQSRGIHEHYGVSPYWEEDQRQMMQDTEKNQMMQGTEENQMMRDRDQQKNQQKY
ncbi:MAG: PRC-barrel domain-containing protein [Pelovirga sp.]